MSKLILFSENNKEVFDKVFPEIFIAKNMQVAYMPSDGASEKNSKYESIWREIIESRGSTIVPINNSLRGASAVKESQKIQGCDVLIWTGGNTFTFLDHLRKSGLDATIKEFARTAKTIVGFSAGAIILSPTIEVADIPGYDENSVCLTDLRGLNVVDFDVFLHYEEEKSEEIVRGYEEKTGKKVIRIKNNEYLIVENGEVKKF
jgi:dipeptidase E